MRVAFHTLGCKVNQYETEALREQFSAAGYQLAAEDERADVYVINTCTVTNLADRKSRQFIRQARRRNPDAVIAVAAAQIGYKEKASNSSLDDKTANAGSANFTKYANEIDTRYPNWYNGRKNGYAWCDVFVDWCFLTAFGYEKALALLCQPEKSCGAGCTYSLRYYKAKGQFHTSGPQPGDQIFFGT